MNCIVQSVCLTLCVSVSVCTKISTSGLRHIYEVQRMQALSVTLFWVALRFLTCLCSYFHHLKYKLEVRLPSRFSFSFSPDLLCLYMHIVLRVILFKQTGLFWGTPTQMKILFSFRVNITWRHINDLLMLQGLWDVSIQGRCSCLTTREQGSVRSAAYTLYANRDVYSFLKKLHFGALKELQVHSGNCLLERDVYK